MGKRHRIAAGGITFKDDAVLLVRYRDNRGGTYLAGAGGGLQDDETVVQAIVRETLEETSVSVKPERVVIIEDLISSRVKMCKIWMVCEYAGGRVRRTEEAEKEGIVEVGWFTRDQLVGEIVFPTPLIDDDWDQLRSGDGQVRCLSSRKMRF